MTKILNLFLFALIVSGCVIDEKKSTLDENGNKQEVNVYTHRHYDVDRKIFRKFEKETGINVNIIDDDADKLLVRLESEGKNSPCDVFMTVDAGRLVRAKNKKLLQAIEDEKILLLVPKNLRDAQGFWIAQTVRARIIVYSKERVDTNQLSTYEDLVNEKWKGKLVMRSSDNIYNQSLLASIVAYNGIVEATNWAQGIVNNLAREPKGNDKDQVKAIAAGEGDISLVNTYYIGQMLESKDKGEVDAVNKIGIFYPNQKARGAHINISGAGIAKYAPNKKNALKLLDFMLRDDIQKMFAESNNEFPVNKSSTVKPILANWSKYLTDTLDLQKLGELNTDALKIFNQVGWK